MMGNYLPSFSLAGDETKWGQVSSDQSAENKKYVREGDLSLGT